MAEFMHCNKERFVCGQAAPRVEGNPPLESGPFRELRAHESSAAPANILHEESYAADQRVLTQMEDGDHAGIIGGMDEYRRAAPEGHFGHYLMMAAAIGGERCQAPGERYSEYEASVGTGQVHVWFERPSGGWSSAA